MSTVANHITPRSTDLLACVKNVNDLDAIFGNPGWRFRLPDGHMHAAAYVQRMWRGYQARARLFQANYAATRIQTAFRLYRVRLQTQAIIADVRQRRAEQFRKIQMRFKERWMSIKTAPHVIIHLPSLPRQVHSIV